MDFKVRSFNKLGIDAFVEHLTQVRLSQTNGAFNRSLLEDGKLAPEIEGNLCINDQQFSDKYHFAKYIVDTLSLQKNKHLYYNVGLWTWLSAFYFDQVCPMHNGQRKPGQEARHVLQEPKNYKVYYRHLLAGPARIYAELGDKGRIFLAGDLAKRGDLVEQLQAYQNIGLNRSIIEAADNLYWDEAKHNLKRGVGSKGPGSPRRFVNVIGQFELTYDLNSMKSESILELLPNEFKKWRTQNALQRQ